MNGKLTKEWIKKAEQDFSIAQILMRGRKKDVYDGLCFHCQQCIEKYLKAYLTFKNEKFPRVHDLGELLILASKLDGSFELIRDIILPLSKYAVLNRYPGEEAHRDEAKAAFEATKEARKFIKEKTRGK